MFEPIVEPGRPQQAATTAPPNARSSSLLSADRLTRRQQLRAVVAATAGTTIEWYDFLLFSSVAAIYLGPAFFPSNDPLLSTMAAFSSFFVGFLARPIGAAIFGHFGDRVGRKAALVATQLMMGTATVAIGLVPTHAQIGIWGGVIVVVLRVFQGLGVGGEWAGSVLLAVEWGQRGRRGFLGAFPQLGVPIGLMLSMAALQASTLALGEGSYWAWRVPFLASIVLVGLALYVRLGILETPVFTSLLESRRTERSPVTMVVRTQWREVILSCLTRTGELAPAYIYSSFTLLYVTGFLHEDQSVALNAMLAFGAVSLFTCILFGRLSDRAGRKRISMIGAAAAFVWALPYFGLLDSRVPLLLVLAGVVTAPVRDAMYGPQAALIAESFTGRLRYSGASLGYHLAAVTAGGPAPLIALFLLQQYHSSTPIALYMMACAAVSLVAIALMRERSERDLAVEYDQGRAGPGPGHAPAWRADAGVHRARAR